MLIKLLALTGFLFLLKQSKENLAAVIGIGFVLAIIAVVGLFAIGLIGGAAWAITSPATFIFIIVSIIIVKAWIDLLKNQ